jgi:hypothetical protein
MSDINLFKKYRFILIVMGIVFAAVGYGVYQNFEDGRLLREQSEIVPGIVVKQVGKSAHIRYLVQGKEYITHRQIRSFQYEHGIDIDIGDTISVKYFPPSPDVSYSILMSWFDYKN